MCAKDFGRVVVATHDGAPVYLEDVAKCEDGLETDDLSMVFWGQELPHFTASIMMGVYQAPGSNTVEVAQKVKALIPRLQKVMPPSVTLVPVHDKSRTILDSIGEVKETLVIAFVLVTLVVFAFLGRVRETVVPVVAMPLSLLITFIAMRMLGYSLDNLSLMALTLAIGFLVDDAIVFLENVVRHMEDGMSPIDAAFKSAGEISATIVSMTLSLMATFVPLGIMPGQIGRVFREFSVTIMVATFASGLVSLLITPVMCGYFLKSHGKKTGLEQFLCGVERGFRRWYGRILRRFLNFPWISWWIWTFCVVGTVVLFLWMPKTFLPCGDSGVVIGMFMAKSGTSPQRMKHYQSQVINSLKKHPSVKFIVSVVGIEGYFQGNMGFMVLVAYPKKQRDSMFSSKKKLSIDELSSEFAVLMAQTPGVIPLVEPMPVLNISTSATDNSRGKYCYTLSGMNSKEVYGAMETLKNQMRGISGIVPRTVNSDVELSNPELKIAYHRNHLFRAGLSPAQIETALGQAYALNYIALIKGEYEQYKIILDPGTKDRSNAKDLHWLFVKNARGDTVPVDGLTETELGLGPTVVCHRANIPSASIFFNIDPGVPLGEVTKRVEAAAAKILPNGVTGEFSGEAKDFRESVLNLTLLLFLAVFIMYVVLGILYEHWIHPLTVLSTIPIALVGGLLTLFLCRAEFSLYAFIGLFMLIGIVKKNGIILIDFANEKRKIGIDPVEAIYEACLERVRPIMMTTVSTIFGILPIALGFGADGASRTPLGLSVVGGMFFAQCFTLFVTPVIYIGMDRMSSRSA
jgi:HAE1 family hydrophobic/amphiphilic exporter-1